MKDHSVYALWDPATHAVKFGVTGRPIGRRFAEIRREVPGLGLIFVLPKLTFERAYRIEHELHEACGGICGPTWARHPQSVEWFEWSQPASDALAYLRSLARA